MASILKYIDQRERQLEYEVEYAKAEAEHWKKKYDELINQSIQHSEQTMGNMIRVLLHEGQGGVVKCIT